MNTIINDIEYEEINRHEYKRLKKADPENVNGYTARVGFKCYKKKEPKFPKTFKNVHADIEVEIHENGYATINNKYEAVCVLGNYPNARWDLIEQALNYVKEIK